MLTIIDFYADWCKPCKQYDEILPEMAAEYGFELRKVDVEEESDVAADLGITGLPTLLLVEDEAVLGKLEGAYPKARLIVKLEEILGYSLCKNSTQQSISIEEYSRSRVVE